MQKIVRRTALARNQAQRKLIRGNKAAEREELNDSLRQRFAVNRMELDNIRAERLRRREDWMRGPLAPQRDAGPDGKKFGSLSPQAMRPPTIPKHLRRKYINFAPGDRVCIIKGRDKGKIDVVTRVDHENETLSLKELNMADVAFPEWLLEQNNNNNSFQPIPLPISVDDVRLVAALDDPATGVTRDVLVEHMRGGGPILEREHGAETPKHTRYIAGEEIEIPWPRVDKPQFKDEEWDTLRMEVETPTWVPSLHFAPFPPSVIDELRNKFSKYRTRHDPEFVAERRMEDLKKEYIQSMSLLTPRGELQALRVRKAAETRQKRTDKNGNWKLDQDTSSFIKTYMEAQAAKAAGPVEPAKPAEPVKSAKKARKPKKGKSAKPQTV